MYVRHILIKIHTLNKERRYKKKKESQYASVFMDCWIDSKAYWEMQFKEYQCWLMSWIFLHLWSAVKDGLCGRKGGDQSCFRAVRLAQMWGIKTVMGVQMGCKRPAGDTRNSDGNRNEKEVINLRDYHKGKFTRFNDRINTGKESRGDKS